MPRIEDSVFQDEVASSLLSPAELEHEQAQPEQQESEYARDATDLLDEAIREQGDRRFAIGDEETERLRSERGEQERPEPRQEQPTLSLQEKIARQEEARTQEQANQEPSSQQVEPSPQQVDQVIKELDSKIKECGLDIPSETVKFETELASMFGTRPENVGAMDRTIGRTALAAGEYVGAGNFPADGDLGKIRSIPAEAARAISHDVAGWFGINTQINPLHDEQFVGDTIFRGIANYLNTRAANPNETNPANRNDWRMCVGICEAVQWGIFGVQNPVPRELACKIVNHVTERIDAMDTKVREWQARQGQGSRSNTGRGKAQRIPAHFREGIKGSKIAKLTTNTDIFDNETLATMARRHL